MKYYACVQGEAFYSLKPRARLPQLVSLVDYIERQWFRNPVFRVDDWSVFRQTVRTNNDVEDSTIFAETDCSRAECDQQLS